MTTDKRVIIWNNGAAVYFRKTYDRINKDSKKNAEKVRAEIIKIVERLVDNPQKYKLDKYKKNNPGNYRAFELYSYRIAYSHTPKEIRILRIRHIKQEPKGY